LKVIRMESEKGEEQTRANPGNRFFLHTEPSLPQGKLNGILRRVKRM